MAGIFPVPEPVTAEWLSAVLPGARVQEVTEEANPAFNSRTRHLHVRYAIAAAALPECLVLKESGAEPWMVEAGQAEVAFYQLAASLDPPPPGLVPCLAAAASDVGSFLLLTDLGATHQPPATRDEQIALSEHAPTAADCERVVDTLARHHAYWWDRPLLHDGRFEVGYWTRSAERFAAYVERRRRAWESLVAAEAGWFPPDLRALYERVFAGLERHWRRWLLPRFAERRNLTLVHGDAYFANFLCPRPGQTGETYLLDWQSPSVDLAGYDLANLLASFWTRERRMRDDLERRLLARYHATLVSHGVADYRWEALLADYRSGLIFWLLLPLQDRLDGAERAYWWPKMQCLAAAFEDWGCLDLLESGEA